MSKEDLHQIEKRKEEHVKRVLDGDTQYTKSAGFESIEFVHNSLPEIDFNEVNLSVEFLGKKLNAPLMIVGMTGGFKQAGKINKGLAKAAEKYGLAFGLGSQRAMLRNKKDESYGVREVAPNIPIIGNIGAVQLKEYPIEDIKWLVESVDADGLALHLNPLQEIIQPEGDTDFSGVLDKIKELCKELKVPVIGKETGAGISREVALKLKKAGVKYLDVSGRGGTSWSKVEYLRGGKVPGFENWGISTLESVLECKGILPLIASGGVRSGIDVAKSIALGAELGGAAYPFLKAFKEGNLDEEIEKWIKQIQICAFLTGSENIAELKKARMFVR